MLWGQLEQRPCGKSPGTAKRPLCLQWDMSWKDKQHVEEVGKGQGKALNFNLEAIRRLSFSLIKYYNVTPLCICMHFSEIYREIPYIFYPVSPKGNILQSYSPISKPRD